MGKMNSVIIVLQILITISAASTNPGFIQPMDAESVPENVFVVFDPNVSILDKPNLLRYDSTDQIPLVSKVATKFKRLFIQLTEVDMDYYLETSLSLSAMAIANYNKQSGPGEKIEVWLAYSTNMHDYRYIDDFLYHKEPQRIMERLHFIANESNAICNGTVTTILLPYKLLINLNTTFYDNLFSGLHWGFLFETDVVYTYSTSQAKEIVTKLRPDAIIVVLRPISSVAAISETENRIAEVKGKLEGANVSMYGCIVTTHDTDFTGQMDLSTLVSIWKEAEDWANKTGNILILSKAFDTPNGDSVERKTGGWWRLVENPNYNSPNDYKFEEKAEVTKVYGKSGSESETNLNWLKENTKFSKDYVQIIFSLFDLRRAKNIKPFSEIEQNSLLESMIEKFDRFVIILHDDTEKGLRVLIYELLCLNVTLEGNVEISIVVLPGFQLDKIFKHQITFKGLLKDFPQYSSVLTAVKSYVVPYAGNGSIDVFRPFMEGVHPSQYNFSYSFNISTCSEMSLANNWREMHDIMRKDGATSFTFFFEEADPTVKLGASRMIKQRIVTMEHCRKLVHKWGLTRKVKISFMLLHYSTSTEFYVNKWEMINFIDYWQKLSAWAKETGSTVTMSSVMDSHRYFTAKGKHEAELGWWRLRNSVERKMGDDNSNVWINKIDDAILRFSSSSTSVLSTTQIVLISTFSLMGLIIAAVTVALVMRRRSIRRLDLITDEEIKNFHQGMIISQSELGTANALYKLPYEKSQYEISKDKFTIDVETALGSGEFGLVCSGKVLVNGEMCKVATKMINPHNFHKTTLKGLLSEIKVLAYVGRHDNITQLIGANTQDLKFGKVYIFLELCELGSLEKHLRTLKSSLQNDKGKEPKTIKNEYSLLDARTNKYLEMVSMKKMSLELSVSQDLLRWSHEICKGMAYLASKHVVHADLATRNVLLNEHKEAKICDFGLSRRMYNYTNYVKEQQEPLPWKWMSPEALKVSEFSEKSDVWAYGVTLWEMFSMGEQPYAGLSWSLKFADMLEQGFRLDEPKFDVSNMYLIMKECWNTVPRNRPTFAELLSSFD